MPSSQQTVWARHPTHRRALRQRPAGQARLGCTRRNACCHWIQSQALHQLPGAIDSHRQPHSPQLNQYDWPDQRHCVILSRLRHQRRGREQQHDLGDCVIRCLNYLLPGIRPPCLTGHRRDSLGFVLGTVCRGLAESLRYPPASHRKDGTAHFRPEQGDMRLRRLREEVGADPGHPWTIALLADRIGIGGEHLRRLCQRHLGRSPMSHGVSLRVRLAIALLASDLCTIEVVAQTVGCDDPFAFSTAFKRCQGISSSEYRAKAFGPADRG